MSPDMNKVVFMNQSLRYSWEWESALGSELCLEPLLLVEDLELLDDVEEDTDELDDEWIGVPSPHSRLSLIWLKILQFIKIANKGEKSMSYLICLSRARIRSFCSLTTSRTSWIEGTRVDSVEVAAYNWASLISNSSLMAVIFFSKIMYFNPDFCCISKMAELNFEWISSLSSAEKKRQSVA